MRAAVFKFACIILFAMLCHLLSLLWQYLSGHPNCCPHILPVVLLVGHCGKHNVKLNGPQRSQAALMSLRPALIIASSILQRERVSTQPQLQLTTSVPTRAFFRWEACSYERKINADHYKHDDCILHGGMTLSGSGNSKKAKFIRPNQMPGMSCHQKHGLHIWLCP